jgi:chlorite dismutase
VGSLQPVYTFLSVTELPEYVTTDDDLVRSLQQEGLQPGTDAYNQKLEAAKKRQAEYEQYRLYPELPDWEVMAFYPMSKRRSGNDNWYTLDFETRKKLMGGHARVAANSRDASASSSPARPALDDWEWGVTLMAHQLDALKRLSTKCASTKSAPATASSALFTSTCDCNRMTSGRT